MMYYTTNDLQDYAKAYARAAIEADRKRKQADPTTLTNLHTLTLDRMRELAMRDCSEYSFDDLAIAWELFDRLVEGGRIIEADCHPTDTQQKLNEVLEYLQNETMKLEAAYGNNFKKEATEKARAATKKMKEAVYAINKSDRKRRGEPVPKGWKLVPETPTSKQIVHMACQIKGADADGWFRTDGDDWPEHVDAAERAYKWALSEAPQPAEPVVVAHGENRVNIGLEAETGSDLGGVVDHGEAEPDTGETMTRHIRLNGKWVPCRILKSGARMITARRDD